MKSMKIVLPEFYVALVLESDTKGEPTVNQLNELKSITKEHLMKRLQSTKSLPTIVQFVFEFHNLQYKISKPEAKFQIYWEVITMIEFQPESKTTRRPDPQDLFDILGMGFDGKEWLLLIRDSLPNESPLSSVKEVTIRRLKRPGQGGAVQAPPWYMGFKCVEKPTRQPNEKELKKLQKEVTIEATRHLKKAYKDDFQDLTLKIIKTEINDKACRPSKEYILYIQYETVVNFSANSPEPMEMFQVLTQCTSTEFMMKCLKIPGPIADIETVALNVCVWIDKPEDPEEEKEQDDGEDGEDEPKEEDQEEKLVKVHVEFYVALVVDQLEELPTTENLQPYDELMKDFFTDHLETIYNDKDGTKEKETGKPQRRQFATLALEPHPEYGAGRPLERFNMLHRYEADMEFVDPPPEPMEILSKIVQCDVGSLMAQIGTLSVEPWKNTKAATLGSANYTKPPSDKIYGGRLEIDPIPIMSKEAPSPSPPQEDQQEQEEREKAAKKKQEEEEAAAAKKKMQEETAKQEALKKKKAEEEEAAKKKKKAEEEAKAFEESKKRAEEAAKKKAEEAAAKKKAEEEAKKKADEEARKKMEEIRKKAEKAEQEAAAAAAKKKEEEEKAVAAAAAAKKKKEEDEAAAAAAKKKEEEEEAKKKKAEEEAAKKKQAEEEAAKKAKKAKPPPPAKPEPTKPEIDFYALLLSDVYLALTVQDLDEEPSPQHYKKLIKASKNYYTYFLEKEYGDNFKGVDVSIRNSAFNEEKPNPKYNVYVEWDILAKFADQSKAPDVHHLCRTMVAAELMVYLKDYIRQCGGTPFQDSTGIYTQQITKAKRGSVFKS